MNWFQKFAKDQRGSPAVEFAIVSPIFIVMLIGTFEFGRALYESNRMNAAAAAGARAIVIHGSSNNTPIIDAIEAKLHNYDPNKLTISIVDKEIADTTFKEINITYTHEYIVKLGSILSDVELESTRYAPARP